MDVNSYDPASTDGGSGEDDAFGGNVGFAYLGEVIEQTQKVTADGVVIFGGEGEV